MRNLLTAAQIREADQVTIGNKHLSSENLMEIAGLAFTGQFIKDHPSREKKISVYCGTGNNGGDGMAIARLLKQAGYRQINVKIAAFNMKRSPDFSANYDRAKLANLEIRTIDTAAGITDDADLLIDALLGSGLNRPLAGEWKKLVKSLNKLEKQVIGVDVPTGFITEGPVGPSQISLKCAAVYTFQLPKINFFFPEAARAMDNFTVLDIGLDEEFMSAQPGHFKLVTGQDIGALLKPRKAFSHKGTYGHTLLVAGKPETMGAALLCAGASVHCGSGLTTAWIPPGGLTAMNISYPEVMVTIREETKDKRRKPKDKILVDDDRFTSLVIGPGLGSGDDTLAILTELLTKKKKGLVLDADALNVLALNVSLFELLGPGTIITPHMKEFDRLFGEHEHWWGRIETARKKAHAHQLIIILKNRYTFIVTPRKEVYINPTGGPAMATGGMGDVLAGIIGAMLSQGYEPAAAAIAGVYLHGSCGERYDRHIVTPSEIIKILPEVMWDLTVRD